MAQLTFWKVFGANAVCSHCSHRQPLRACSGCIRRGWRHADAADGQKKADVMEHPRVFHHVGLLVNEPPSNGQAALYVVIRRPAIASAAPCPQLPSTPLTAILYSAGPRTQAGYRCGSAFVIILACSPSLLDGKHEF